jgi:signal peptide peptidase SppA
MSCWPKGATPSPLIARCLMSLHNASRYAHLISWVVLHPWALDRETCALIANLLVGRMAGDDEAEAEGIALAAQLRAARTVPVPSGGAIAVIPIKGVIAPRMNMFSEISGGATFEALGQQVEDAARDPNVKTIVLDVDSPGGNVAGATVFHQQVAAANKQKPVIGQVQYTGASAAYWALAACEEIVAAPESLVGSIGVFALHDAIGEALARRGIKREVMSAGKYKAEGVDGGALSPEARAHVQGLIDGAYGRFVGDVARGRGVTPAAVRDGFGEGRVVDAEQALALGMIDRIATLQDTLARVASSPSGALRAAAHASSAVTDQEQPPLAAAVATSQQSRIVRDATFIEFERRVLEHQLRGLQP